MQKFSTPRAWKIADVPPLPKASTIDDISGFFEIDRLYDLKVSTVIRKLRTHMARYGVPDEVVSDSGSQYTSREFKNFAKEYGFNHVTTSPYHHQSNGRAESAVKEAKKILKKMQRPKVTPTWRCWLIVTPHRKDSVPALLSVCLVGEQKQTFLLLVTC